MGCIFHRYLCSISVASLIWAAAPPLSAGPASTTDDNSKKAEECCEHCKKSENRLGATSNQRRYLRSVASYKTPDVALVDGRGRRVKLAAALDHDGPVMLQFIFTTCPTICPALTASFSAAQESLGSELKKVRMISISIDPEHDRPERLKQYSQVHQARAQWSFYTGSVEDITSVRKAFNAYQSSKMAHEPLYFMRPHRDAPWIRLNGILSASELVAEYRRMIQP